MPKKMFREPRELGCPVSEFVRKVLGSREASRAEFQTIGQFGSAQLSVGQEIKFRPRLGRPSVRERNLVRMPTPAPDNAKKTPNDAAEGQSRVVPSADPSSLDSVPKRHGQFLPNRLSNATVKSNHLELMRLLKVSADKMGDENFTKSKSWTRIITLTKTLYSRDSPLRYLSTTLLVDPNLRLKQMLSEERDEDARRK
jgi:hypothetical protein